MNVKGNFRGNSQDCTRHLGINQKSTSSAELQSCACDTFKNDDNAVDRESDCKESPFIASLIDFTSKLVRSMASRELETIKHANVHKLRIVHYHFRMNFKSVKNQNVMKN